MEGEAQKLQVLQTFEKACLDFLNPTTQKEAEKIIVEFRKLPAVIAYCRYILEKTSLPLAQFQAVSTLRDSIIREWVNITLEEKESIRSFLLEFIMSSQKLEPYVEKQALQTNAIMCKRGWLEGSVEDQIRFRNCVLIPLTQVLEKMEQPDSPNFQHVMKMKHVAVNLLSALVDEFTYSKSNSIGLTWEYHHRCLVAFQKGELKQVFTLAMNLLRKIATIGLPKLLKDALTLTVQILCWRFEESDIEKYNISFRSAVATTIRPGTEWRDLLIEGDTLQVFLELYGAFRTQEDINHLILTSLTQLASINGKIFPDEKTRGLYISQMLQGLLSILKMPSIGLVEISGISQIVQRITGNFKLSSLILMPDLFAQFTAEFTNFTCNCLNVLQTTHNNEVKSEVEQCFDTLLESWVILLAEKSTQGLKATPLIREYTSRIFQLYVITRLTLARNELEGDEEAEDESLYDEQLNSVSFLGRIDPLNSIQGLNQLIIERLHLLQQGISEQKRIEIFEEIHWLVLISGHILSDSAEGEVPIVPDAINLISKSFESQAAEDPIVIIIGSIFKLLDLENQFLNTNRRDLVSPLIGQTLIWFVNRWCSSYLMSENATLSANIMKAYGPTDNGIRILDFIVRKISINFEKWSGETNLLKQTSKLFLTLSQSRGVGKVLLKLPSWMDILQAHSSSHPTLNKLPSMVQREFMQALLNLSDLAGDNLEQSKQYLLQVINPVLSAFSSLIQQQDFVKVSQNPEVILKIQMILEKFRGMSRALISDDNIIFEMCSQYFNTFVGLLEVYKNFPEVVILILKFYCDFTEYQTENLSKKQAQVLYVAIIDLLKKYTACNFGKSIVVISKDLASEAEKEAYKDVLAIINLLCILAGHSHINQVQDVISLGISIVLPLITKQLLEFPKLCRYYYNLIGSICEQCPSKVVMIPPEMFKNLISTLEYGVNHYDSDVACKSLESIGSLAKFSYSTLEEKGVSGLHQQQSANPSLMFDIFKFLFHFILFGDFSSDLINAVADALYSMICAEQKIYQTIVGQLIQQQTDPVVQQRLIIAFNKLMSDVNVSFDRQTQEHFKSNMQEFLTNVKSFLLTK